MPNHERVTVTLPADVVRDIDRVENNRSRFVFQAIRRELERRRREHLRRSLASPHPETAQFTEAGFDEWAASLPDEDVSDLVDVRAGIVVRWMAGKGWVETKK